ncbi:hypothetical protein ACQRBF_01150 [Peptoniphilaceae bacterium SGI.131]
MIKISRFIKIFLLVIFIALLSSCGKSNQNITKIDKDNRELPVIVEKQKDGELLADMSKLKSIKKSETDNFYGLYKYLIDVFSFEDYKLTEKSGEADSKVLFSVEKDATFNDRYERADSEGRTRVLNLTYESGKKSKIDIAVFNDEDDLDYYTFSYDHFLPETKNNTFSQYFIKYRDYFLLVNFSFYHDEDADITEEKICKSDTVNATDITKYIIKLLKEYELKK